MTKAQEIYERIESLVAEGMSRPDAFRQLAKELNQKFDSIRGAYYTGRQQATGATGTPRGRRPRKRETTEQDAVEAAVATLEQAIASIEREVTAAEERAREAQAEHEAMAAMSGPRIAAIRAKIAVLSQADEEEAS
jgi:hypothetical protein